MSNATLSRNGSNVSSLNSSSTQPKLREWETQKEILHTKLLRGLKPDVFRKHNPIELDLHLRPQIIEFVQKNISSRFSSDFERMGGELFEELIGLGPMESLMEEKGISEIMVNAYDRIYVEKGGKIARTDVQFRSEEHLRLIIEQIVSRVGRRIDEKSPMVDARLEDGSRVNIIIPPAAIQGAKITIRRFSSNLITPDKLVKMGSISHDMFTFLEAAVSGSLNIIISGRTGSGKTTLLNILSSFIPSHERIVTVEDSAELSLQQEHVISLETVQPDREGKSEVTIQDLVKNSLRMRPDRIVVGECRGKEALDMLQAMNTGHEGSMSTLHANSPRDAISRIATMALMAGYDLPEAVIRSQIASAVDLIVQVDRLPDGSRKITKISEIAGMEGEIITMQDIYDFEWSMEENGKCVGRHKSMGIRPKCASKLLEKGRSLPEFHESSTVSVSRRNIETPSDIKWDDDSLLKVR